MFVYVSLLALALPVLVLGSPTPGGQNDPCSTGNVQCCNSVQTAQNSPPEVKNLLKGLLGLILQPQTSLGLTCNPITAVGAGGTSCTQQTVCCSGNAIGGGLVVIGCSPININS